MSDVGNTIGRLQGQVAMSSAPAAEANPAVVAETAEEAGWLGWVHNGLDGLGAIPEVGAVFDGANALVYAAEGNAVQAGISGGAAALDLVPGLGTAGKVAEFGVKGAAKLAAKEAVEQGAKSEAKQLAKEGAETVAKDATKSTEKAGVKKAEEQVGEDGAKVKKQKPDERCGKFGKFKDLVPEARVIERDHVPSSAALKRAMNALIDKLPEAVALSRSERQNILNHLHNEAPAVSIPADVHAEGETWRGRNTQKKISVDSDDLKKAVDRDTQAIQDSMDQKDHGCSEAYAAAAKQLKDYDYSKLMKDVLDKKLKEFGLR
jgi:hypothetical protein